MARGLKVTLAPLLVHSAVFELTMKRWRAFRLQCSSVFVALLAWHVVQAERFVASPGSNTVASYSDEFPECQAIRQFRSKAIEQSLINDGKPLLLGYEGMMFCSQTLLRPVSSTL